MNELQIKYHLKRLWVNFTRLQQIIRSFLNFVIFNQNTLIHLNHRILICLFHHHSVQEHQKHSKKKTINHYQCDQFFLNKRLLDFRTRINFDQNFFWKNIDVQNSFVITSINVEISKELKKNYTQQMTSSSKEIQRRISNVTSISTTMILNAAIRQIIEQTMQIAMIVVLQNLSQKTKKSSNSFDFIKSSESIEVSNELTHQTTRWNSNNIEFFDFNHDEKSTFIDQAMKHFEKNTYYRNVHIFTKKMKEMTIVLSLELVKRNLATCLRDTALIWHTAKLIDSVKRLLTYDNDVEKWIQTLITRFKKQSFIAIASFLKERYIMNDAKRNRKSREYAQKIIRLIKFAKMNFAFNQLIIMYNEIDVKLRRDLKR